MTNSRAPTAPAAVAMGDGAAGSTSDSGSEGPRFDPWSPSHKIKTLAAQARGRAALSQLALARRIGSCYAHRVPHGRALPWTGDHVVASARCAACGRASRRRPRPVAALSTCMSGRPQRPPMTIVSLRADMTTPRARGAGRRGQAQAAGRTRRRPIAQKVRMARWNAGRLTAGKSRSRADGAQMPTAISHRWIRRAQPVTGSRPSTGRCANPARRARGRRQA